MQKFFQRIGQWLRQLFAPLVGGGSGARGNQTLAEVAPLNDTDYEFLFNQLLEGIAHGWHEGRILKFFRQLEGRCRPKEWLGWLDRFEHIVLQSPSPNLILAARMMRLGELAQSFPQIAPIGDRAYQIGRELYGRQSSDQGEGIWEYDGPDGALAAGTEAPAEGQTESFTFEELVERLPKDEMLVAHFAGFLGIESTDPQVILQGLIEKFSIPAEITDQVPGLGATEEMETPAPQDNLPGEEEPQGLEAWFYLGLQQAEKGELEAAIASWSRCIELDPAMGPAWQNRGSALGNLGRLGEALENFDQGVVQNPHDAQLWLSRGFVLEALDMQEAAATSYQRAWDLDQTLTEAGEKLQQLPPSLPHEPSQP